MGKRAQIITALPGHIGPIGQNVREADKLEFAANMRTAEQVMTAGLKISTVAWTGLVDDVPVCMFGVAPVGSIFIAEYGRPWMVGTRLLDDVAVLFLRRCRGQIKEMLDLYPVLSNYVAASNTQAIRWLRWLGFKVSDFPVPMGIRAVPFLHFELRR